MSNLGWYQIMTTVAKKVGGPRNLAGLLIGGGAIVGGTVVAGSVAIKNNIDRILYEKKRKETAAIVHTIMTEAQSNEGLIFRVGDQFKVLEIDGDAALIEKIGEITNPYFVSAEFLKAISDYE